MHGTQKGLVDHMQKTPEDHKATKTKQKNHSKPKKKPNQPTKPKHHHHHLPNHQKQNTRKKRSLAHRTVQSFF